MAATSPDETAVKIMQLLDRMETELTATKDSSL